jgi:MoxR-like ATPase
LADEINRATPKTQSAVLEAMQERTVSVARTTHPLPGPFLVLATQNPLEMEGTYPLPEAQLDRFLFKLNVLTVDVDVMDSIISTRRRGEPPRPEWTMQPEEFVSLFDIMDRVYMPKAVSRYIARLVAMTHPENRHCVEPVREYVTYGASPRAAIAMAEASRGSALLSGRPTVGFEDVKAVAPAVLNHRLILNYKARFDRVNAFSVIDELLAGTDETQMDLPQDISISE